MYTMGVYELYEGNYQLLDSIRSRFYWQGTGKKRKYHMVKWEALSRPKEFGGLGFLDVRVMNICLLAKWIAKLETGDSSLCCSLLRQKYLGQKSIYQLRRKTGSQFWRSLLGMRDWFQRGRKIEIKAGVQTRFWLDCWLGECPLKVSFYKLFQIASDQNLEVSKACVQGQWEISFRRQLDDSQRQEWAELLEILNEVQLTEGVDKMVWALEKSGQYTTRSLYKSLTNGGMADARAMLIWKSPIPLKVKNFMWMANHDRIQCGVQLKKKKWTGSEKCPVCEVDETSDHILFQCPLAVLLWSFLRDCLGWPSSPTSCSSLLLEIVDQYRGNKQLLTIFICAGALWSIWKTRNELVFDKKVVSSPSTLIYKALLLAKSWRPLLKPKMMPMADGMLNNISSRVASM